MTKFSGTISVIVPVYKVENYLPKCVDSIISQTYKDFEIILVDDGSPDNCPSICDDYARRDTRVKVIHKQNGGLSDARNAGIRAAKGDYIVFLDSDDWIEEDSLKGIADIAGQKNPDVIVGNIKYMDETGGESISGYIGKAEAIEKGIDSAVSYFSKFGIYWPAFRFIPKKSFIDEKKLFFYEGILHEDMQWVARLVAVARSFALFKDKFYCYRTVREGSITRNKTYKNYSDMVKISESLFKEAQGLEGTAYEYVIKGAKMSLLLSMEGYGSFSADEKRKFKDAIISGETVRRTMESTKKTGIFVKILGLWNGLRAYAFIADKIGQVNEKLRNG
jgi:glycosyltransferase involved in cell wall biosynthesis